MLISEVGLSYEELYTISWDDAINMLMIHKVKKEIKQEDMEKEKRKTKREINKVK